MERRAQAALEFLTTYAWAFIVILVTIGSLYYFGVFDFTRFVPEKCTFSPQFACADFAMSQSDISVRLANTLGESVNVTSAQISDDSAIPLSCNSPIKTAPSQPTHLNWASGVTLDVNFTSCSGGSLSPGERIDARIRLVYYAMNSPSKTPHSVQGKVSGKVLG